MNDRPVPETHPHPSRYSGQCSACSTPRRPGDLIVRMSDGTFQHAHHHEEETP